MGGDGRAASRSDQPTRVGHSEDLHALERALGANRAMPYSLFLSVLSTIKTTTKLGSKTNNQRFPSNGGQQYRNPCPVAFGRS